MNLNRAVAIRISQLLKEKDLTQYKLEKNSGLLHGTVSNIMAEKNKTVTLTTIFKLAKGFNIHYLEFLKSSLFEDIFKEL